MSETLSVLRQQAKELRVLADDFGRVRRDWARTIEATRFLGDGMPVEAWFVAEHFLATRADWHLVRSRFDRYFGTSGGRWPRWWLDLDRRCEQMAAELAEDDQLTRLIAESWSVEAQSVGGRTQVAPIRREVAEEAPDQQLTDDEAAEAASLARRAMTGHERVLLVSTLNGHRHTVAAPLVSAAWEQSRHAIAAFDRAPPKARAEVVWQLRNGTFRTPSASCGW